MGQQDYAHPAMPTLACLDSPRDMVTNAQYKCTLDILVSNLSIT